MGDETTNATLPPGVREKANSHAALSRPMSERRLLSVGWGPFSISLIDVAVIEVGDGHDLGFAGKCGVDRSLTEAVCRRPRSLLMFAWPPCCQYGLI